VAVVVRPIADGTELDEVHRLTHDAYASKGYIDSNTDGRLIHYPQLDHIPQTTVLVAVKNGIIVGTNSITLDGPAGLPCEKDFLLQIMRERMAGSALCCSWRIITHPDVRDTFTVLYALIKETCKNIIQQKMNVCLMASHPNDALIYLKMLNAQVIGFSKDTTGLHNAPALLVRGDANSLPKQLRS
jgi:hypothetical protein